MQLPPAVEKAIARYLKKTYPRARGRGLVEDVRVLSESFTSDRGSLPQSYLSQPPARSAYMSYAHPLQLLRGVSALQEVRARAGAAWPGGVDGRLRVLDLGAGLGAMSQALLSVAGEGPWPEIALLDQQRAALRDARGLTAAVALALRPDEAPPRVHTVTAPVDEWLPKAAERGYQYDVVLFGALLNEHSRSWAASLAATLPLVAEGGIVVLVEPAMPRIGRELMQLRESLLEETATIAPCAHQAACPLLRRTRDWCFTVRRAKFPRSVASIARQIGHQDFEVRYAVWAFHPGGAPRDDTTRARFVSDPMEGGALVCTAGGIERSTAAAERGDLAVRAAH